MKGKNAEMEFSVVIPAYDEGENISIVVEDVIRVLDEGGIESYEIILVDDGSNDDTERVVDFLAEKYPFVKALHHSVNRGLGAALKTGYAATCGEHVTFIPSDGEVGADFTIKLLKRVGNADILVSSRNRLTAKLPFHRTILTYGWRLLMTLILGLDQTGMEGTYVVRGNILRSLELESDTGLLNLEIIMRCINIGCTIEKGVIMDVKPRLSGESKVTNLRTTLSILWEMIRLRVRLMKAK